MARGYLFHISETPEHLYPLTPEDFYESPHMMSLCEYYSKDGLSYNKDLWSDELLEYLKALHLPVHKNIDQNNDVQYIMQTDETTTKNYFKSAYWTFRRLTKNLTLDSFINRNIADKLTSSIDDNTSNVVYFNDSAYTFDDFMRIIKPNTIYYIHPVTLLMH